MKYIIMIGLPGAGKGTQSVLLAEKCRLTHLSTGEILRKEIEQGTELGRIAQEFIHQGDFVPDDVTMNMVQEAINNLQDSTEGFVLDGFPRTIPQAVEFEKYLAATHGKLLKVFCLDVPVPIAVERLIKRGQHAERKDDNEKVANKRMEVYYQFTYPLIDYYEQEEILIHINGEDPIEEVTKKIVAFVKNELDCVL